MDRVPEKISFPKTEQEILQFWAEIDAFQTSLKKSEGKPEYTFYDGPPFATGLPHYGHILAGSIKDIVTRYAHMTGHHVARRFGWDCHGLPVEFEVDKQLGIKTRDDVLKMGIPKYNAACRAIVMRYSSEWETIVNRLGRWIDFKNDYKTLDLNFMESVWWVFKEMSKKDMVYRGFKVMPYSTGCTTPLSNFEANLAYKDVDDPAVVVSFPLVDEPETALLAWTTTPWTLPSNLALCVNPTMDYVKLKETATGKQYIMAEKRTVQLYKDESMFQVLGKLKGAELKGKKYVPIFKYFEQEAARGAFQVLVDSYVTDDSGTGVVHQAPAFGEDDYRVCLAAGVIQKGASLVSPVDASGWFTNEVWDFKGMYVKDADKEIIKKLKADGRLVQNAQFRHPYPFCWRSDTPLIYKAVPSWFVAVEKVKDRLLANNKMSYWVPDFVQEKRFHNWLQDARDWAVSRNRYWGTPIPIWTSEDGEEIVVVGSVDELEQLSGVRVNDLHRESIDHITIPSKKTEGGVLRRVEEVFDCWFESGSMPYAQLHYPFENKERFDNGFPADFIAEGLDQTRGWFYTLLVIATVLFDKPPFKNLIVNGLVLAADGKKMSKRLKNYPDPVIILDEYGADALRLYLINSPVVRAEPLRFQEKGVRDNVKDVFLPWFNAYRFLTETVNKFNGENKSSPFAPDRQLALKSTNIMDKWILAATNSLIAFVRKEMEAYRLYTVVPKLVRFIEQLTNWFVRLNRRRLKGSTDDVNDTRAALATLFEVVFTLSKLMAPFTPFITEYFYRNLRKIMPAGSEESVHFLDFPTPLAEALNDRIELAVSRMQSVIQLGRTARDRRTLPIKFPLTAVTVMHRDPEVLSDVLSLKSYILDELNVKEVITTSDESTVVWSAKPDFQLLGQRLKKDFGAVSKAIQQLTHEQIQKFRADGQIEISGHTITSQEMVILREFKGDTKKFEAAYDDLTLIVLDLTVDEKMRQEGVAREVINRIQKLRKKAGVHPTDPIEVFYSAPKDQSLRETLEAQKGYIKVLSVLDFARVFRVCSQRRRCSRLPSLECSVSIASDELRL
eukprot:TRINITY_DN4111_c0_g1_i2.p1 TRINITY_DN4111_c0_g1~~TRINITY_DN4111_c0_g1_i2.p1  ORF type:complete len:1065 (+),score=428.48 TRINITY_DN4111_c0_g1_i2:171-3365(+)